MKEGLILETPRLILREMTEADVPAIHAWAGNPDNVTYMAWGPNSEEQTQWFVSHCIETAQAEPRTKFDFVLQLKFTGQVIGSGGIYRKMDNYNRRFISGEVGWILHMDHWKQGYGSEFCAALLRFGFEELGLNRIYAHSDAENYGSYRIMERNGMRREAVLKQEILGRDGSWHDGYVYAILREEWDKKELP